MDLDSLTSISEVDEVDFDSLTSISEVDEVDLDSLTSISEIAPILAPPTVREGLRRGFSENSIVDDFRLMQFSSRCRLRENGKTLDPQEPDY